MTTAAVAKDEHKAIVPSPGTSIAQKQWFWLTGLSTRLLVLTALFVLLAEVLIFLPSVGRALEVELKDRIKDADLAINMLGALPTSALGPQVDRTLLDYSDALLIARGGDGSSKAVFVTPPRAVDLNVALDQEPRAGLIIKALRLLVLSDDQAVVRARGASPTAPQLSIEMLFRAQPVRAELIGFSTTILWLSLIISLFTAALVFVVLQRSIVRPVRQLSQSMVAFARRPMHHIDLHRGAGRRDEIGEATQALGSLQQTLRNALVQNQRLAALGTGVTQINHDLRNLLGSTLLLSEQLEVSDDPKVKRNIPKIIASVEAAADLCKQTLSFAKSGGPMLRTQAMDVERLMGDLDLQLGPRFPTLDLAVTPPTLSDDQRLSAQVDLDMAQLDRVLVNLIGNAAHAGAVSVWIDASQSDFGSWQLEVSDDGPGFDPGILDRLFEPFAVTTSVEGTGLGLYTAREIMRAHGGDLVLADPGPRAGGEMTRFVLSFGDEVLLGSRH